MRKNPEFYKRILEDTRTGDLILTAHYPTAPYRWKNEIDSDVSIPGYRKWDNFHVSLRSDEDNEASVAEFYAKQASGARLPLFPAAGLDLPPGRSMVYPRARYDVEVLEAAIEQFPDLEFIDLVDPDYHESSRSTAVYDPLQNRSVRLRLADHLRKAGIRLLGDAERRLLDGEFAEGGSGPLILPAETEIGPAAKTRPLTITLHARDYTDPAFRPARAESGFDLSISKRAGRGGTLAAEDSGKVFYRRMAGEAAPGGLIYITWSFLPPQGVVDASLSLLTRSSEPPKGAMNVPLGDHAVYQKRTLVPSGARLGEGHKTQGTVHESRVTSHELTASFVERLKVFAAAVILALGLEFVAARPAFAMETPDLQLSVLSLSATGGALEVGGRGYPSGGEVGVFSVYLSPA